MTSKYIFVKLKSIYPIGSKLRPGDILTIVPDQNLIKFNTACKKGTGREIATFIDSKRISYGLYSNEVRLCSPNIINDF